jgi:hypothetical protein
MTYTLPRLQQQSINDFTQASGDILSGFETTDVIEESADPSALRTRLKPYVGNMSGQELADLGRHRHQRQALTFFLRRERGLHPSGDGFGIWMRQSNNGETK